MAKTTYKFKSRRINMCITKPQGVTEREKKEGGICNVRTGKREMAKRDCGQRASRRGRGQGISTVCKARPLRACPLSPSSSLSHSLLCSSSFFVFRASSVSLIIILLLHLLRPRSNPFFNSDQRQERVWDRVVPWPLL